MRQVLKKIFCDVEMHVQLFIALFKIKIPSMLSRAWDKIEAIFKNLYFKSFFLGKR